MSASILSGTVARVSGPGGLDPVATGSVAVGAAATSVVVAIPGLLPSSIVHVWWAGVPTNNAPIAVSCAADSLKIVCSAPGAGGATAQYAILRF